MKHSSLVCRTILCVLLFIAASFAQTAGTGALTGTVTDPNGASLPEVAVTVINQSTGASWTTATDSSGFYRVPMLPPGNYQVEAKKQGFRTTNSVGVQVIVTETATQNLRMTIGS